ncbi:hypothetical protein BH09BAC3_BH09BAC3_27660 [soil metagenome]
MNLEIDRLKAAIEKFDLGTYNEMEFHKTLQSIAPLVTESHLSKLRNFLFDLEADLEIIDFTAAESLKRNRYSEKIKDLKRYLEDINLRGINL